MRTTDTYPFIRGEYRPAFCAEVSFLNGEVEFFLLLKFDVESLDLDLRLDVYGEEALLFLSFECPPDFLLLFAYSGDLEFVRIRCTRSLRVEELSMPFNAGEQDLERGIVDATLLAFEGFIYI